MKLLIVITDKRDARHLNEALIEYGFRFTELGSTGGFLRSGNLTLLMGVEDDEVEAALTVIQAHCQAREEAVNIAHADTRLDAAALADAVPVQVGGAQVFVLNVERVIQV